MIQLIQGSEQEAYPKVIDGMFRLRARIFHDRMQWPVQVVHGHDDVERVLKFPRQAAATPV